MCEQAARYCRDSVHRLLHKQQRQIAGLDGLFRWVVTKMNDKSSLSERELLQQEGQAAAGQGGFGPGQRKGASVILDVSDFPGRAAGRRARARRSSGASQAPSLRQTNPPPAAARIVMRRILSSSSNTAAGRLVYIYRGPGVGSVARRLAVPEPSLALPLPSSG